MDSNVLANVFSKMEPEDSWLRDARQIESRLRALAAEAIPYAVSLTVNASFRELVGNITLMAKGVGNTEVEQLVSKLQAKADDERARVSASLDSAAVAVLARAEFDRLTSSVAGDDQTWRADIPGRVILNRFAALAGIQVGRLKQLYLSECDIDDTFSDIVSIFEAFGSQSGDATQ